MIAVDTNILVYAHRGESPFYDAAFACLKSLAEGNQRWGIPVACVHEFLAVVTNPKIFSPASTTTEALEQINAWLASPQAQLLHSTDAHWKILSGLSQKAKLAGRQFHDARIATICIENAVSILWTADRDFSRFKSLKTSNPLL